MFQNFIKYHHVYVEESGQSTMWFLLQKNELQHKSHSLSNNKGITSLFDGVALRKMEFRTWGGILAFLKQKYHIVY